MERIKCIYDEIECWVKKIIVDHIIMIIFMLKNNKQIVITFKTYYILIVWLYYLTHVHSIVSLLFNFIAPLAQGIYQLSKFIIDKKYEFD